MLSHALFAALLAGSAFADLGAPMPAPEDTTDPLGGDLPSEAVAPAPGPAPVRPKLPQRDPDNPFPQCQQSLMQAGGNDTHSLMDILESGTVAQQNRGNMDPRFFDLIDLVDQPTMEIINGFNLTGSGYTLIVPEDEAFTYNGTMKEMVDLWTLYGVPENPTQDVATAIVRAHLIEGTIGFPELESRLFGNQTATYTSLEGFEWKIKFVGEMGNMFPVVEDKENRTGTEGYTLKTDITAEGVPANTCPNTVWVVSGFMAGPDAIGPITTAPPPGAAPGPNGVAVPGTDTAGPDIPAGAGADGAPVPPGEAGAAGSGAAPLSMACAAAVGAASFAAVLL